MELIQHKYILERAIEEWYDACIEEFGDDKDMIETHLIEIIKYATEREVRLSQQHETNGVCNHVWATGWVENMVVFCKKCNKDCGVVYPGMPYEDQRLLVRDK